MSFEMLSQSKPTEKSVRIQILKDLIHSLSTIAERESTRQWMDMKRESVGFIQEATEEDLIRNIKKLQARRQAEHDEQMRIQTLERSAVEWVAEKLDATEMEVRIMLRGEN